MTPILATSRLGFLSSEVEGPGSDEEGLGRATPCSVAADTLGVRTVEGGDLSVGPWVTVTSGNDEIK